MGYGFHVRGQRAEGGLRELRAVACGGARLNPRSGGQAVDEVHEEGEEPGQRIALIALVPRGEHGVVRVREHGLDRGGAKVHAEEKGALRGFQRLAGGGVLAVPPPEVGVVRFAFKERGQGRPALLRARF